MKNFVQNSDFVEITALTAIISGKLVQVGNLFGVAVTDIEIGSRGNIALSGVFRLPKLTAAAGDATVEGGPVYFSAASGSVSGASAAGPLCGYATEVAAQSAPTVKVMLHISRMLEDRFIYVTFADGVFIDGIFESPVAPIA